MLAVFVNGLAGGTFGWCGRYPSERNIAFEKDCGVTEGIQITAKWATAAEKAQLLEGPTEK